MRKLLQQKLLNGFLFLALCLTTNMWGQQVNENFNSFTSPGGYGNYTYNGFSIVNGYSETAANSIGGTGHAVRLRNSGTTPSLTYVGSDGNGKDGGVGVISFWYAHYNAGTPITLTVEYSVNGATYVQLSTLSNITSYDYLNYSYTLNNPSDNIRVRVRSNAAERIIIDDFSITNYSCGAPTINTQPVSQTKTAPATATFSVAATGSGTLNYQWQVSSNSGSTWANVSNGGTSASYTTPATQTSMSGYQYRVIVTNTCTSGGTSSVTSNAATLTVNPAVNPTIFVSPASGSGYTYIEGYGPSASQSYNLSGSNLTPLDGNLTVTGTAAYEVSINNVDFSSTLSVPYTGETLAATTIYVRLKAGLTTGAYNSQTVANSGGGATTVNYTASGNVTAATPEIAVSGNGIEITSGTTTTSTDNNTYFGTSLVINQDYNKTFVITNTGTASLNVSNIEVTGTGFTVTSPQTFPVSVAPLGGTQSFTVNFNGETPGDYQGTVTVTNNDANEGSYTFNVAANADVAGPKIEVRGVFASGNTSNIISNGDTTPTGLDNTLFAQQNVGESQTKTFRIENGGNEDLTISSISLDNTADFELNSISFPVILSVGETLDYTITFHPVDYGTREAAVTIVNDDTVHNNNPYTYDVQGQGNAPDIQVSGNGITIANGSTTISSDNYTFIGSANVPGGSVSQNFTVTNVGNTTLNIGTITFTGTDAAQFSATAASASVAAGSSTVITVTYTAATSGFSNAVISIASDDQNENPYTFAVQGFGSSYTECDPGTNGTIIAQDFEGASPLSDSAKWMGTYNGDNFNITIDGGTGYGASSDNGNNPKFIDAASLQFTGLGEEKALTLDAVNTSEYQDISFSFRLASIAATSGNGADSSDYILVETSTDGNNWTGQITVEGNGNAKWSFDSGTGIASTTYGVPANFQSGNGYQTNSGYSTISITGLPSVNTLYFRIKALNNSENEIWAIDNIALQGTLPAQKTYTEAGWSGDGLAPTETERAVIAADLTLQAGDVLNGCELIVKPGVTLTVGSNNEAIATLNIQSNIINNGTIIINDDSALVQYNDGAVNTGAITYNKLANPLYRLDYTLWSSPVEGQNLKEFSPLTTNSRFYEYGFDGTEDAYIAVNPETTDFEPGVGYLIRMPNQLNVVESPADVTENFQAYNAGTYQFAFLGQFTGVPNNGTILVPASTQGERYNGIGNPYASPINVEAFFEANQDVLNNGSITDGNTDAPAIHFWRKKNNANVSSYATLTLAAFTANAGTAEEDSDETTDPDYQYGGQDQAGYYTGDSSNWLIAPGQGFLVQTSASPSETNIVFNNQMRRVAPVTGTAFFRNGNANTISRLWLNLKGAQLGFGQLAVVYKDGATLGLDYGYDGATLANGPLSFYSLAANHTLAIQARPAFDASDVVPLGYTANTAGTYTIAFDHADGVFENGQDIFIKDKLTGITQEVKAADYTFITDAGTFNDRFEVVYINNDALGIQNPVLDDNTVIAYKQDMDIVINSNAVNMVSVNVYDLRGRLLHSEENINGNTLVISGLSASNQVLLLEINTDKGKVSKKIIY